jgi:hypothetical protein
MNLNIPKARSHFGEKEPNYDKSKHSLVINILIEFVGV